MTQYIIETSPIPAQKVVVENGAGQQIVVETPGDDRVIVDFVAGPPGRDADMSYHHIQAMPEAVWTINHGLNKFPSVTSINSSGEVVVGTLSYSGLNTVVLNFAYPFSGEAYLN